MPSATILNLLKISAATGRPIEIRKTAHQIKNTTQTSSLVFIKPSFIKTRLLVWVVFLIWCAVFLISIGLPVAAEILSRFKIVALGIDISYYLAKSITFKYFLPIIIMIIAVAFIFKIMAGKNIKARHAILGSVIFSVLWETAKHLFALYLAHFGSFNKMYGSLGAIMIMLLWIFYSAVILLFSAEFIAAVKTPRKY